MVTAGEGHAPGKSCPCVTVASELNLSSVSKRAVEGAGAAVSAMRGGRTSRGAMGRVGRDGISSTAAILRGNDLSHSQGPIAASVMDEEEVLVEMLDDETGLCLSRRVPVRELRHSTSFFGRKLDDGGATVTQVC